MEKRYSVADLKIDQKIDKEFFALNEFERKLSRLDKPYYNLVLSDKTGEIRGKIWSDALKDCDESAQIGDIVEVNGIVQEYNGRPQLIVERLLVTKGLPPEEFLPVTARDRSLMIEDLEKDIEITSNPFLKKLLNSFWTNPEYRDRFVNFPAGMYVHHGYVGGLIEHVWEMNILSKPFLQIYPMLDRDLFFTGLFFHDIGKLEELDIVGATIVKTDQGNLIAHIGQGLLFVDMLIRDNVPSFPQYLKDKLYHMILAHQGALEKGSPVVPATLEAIVLSMVDDNGAKMNQAVKHIEKNIQTGENFTEYHKWLGTSLFQKDYVTDTHPRENPQDENSN